MKTTIETRIEDELFVATTPHAPELRAQASSESAAVNGLIQAIREHHRAHASRGEPVPWIASPSAARGKDVIVRRLTGLWPAETCEPVPSGNETPVFAAPGGESPPGCLERRD